MPTLKRSMVAFSVFIIIELFCLATLGQEVGSEDTRPGVFAILDEPFSAVRYHRTVKVLSGGNSIVEAESPGIRLGRDTHGRLRVEGVRPITECEQMREPFPPECPVDDVLVYDPGKRSITVWPAGDRAAHYASFFRLSEAQVQEVGEWTANLPDESPESDAHGATVTTQDLGDRTIEGVPSQGVRTTWSITSSIQPKAPADGGEAVVTIHEVWTSLAMKLVMRVIDGDPRKEETISGLEKLSFSPDEALFEVPSDYKVNDHTQLSFPERYLEQLAEWFVK